MYTATRQARWNIGGAQGKRERSMAYQRPPTGPKRSAVVGPPALRGACTTDDDEDAEDDSYSCEAGERAAGGAAGFLDEREAKKQVRKEKNRASAAASRARREAYTASLEEEVRSRAHCQCEPLEGQCGPSHQHVQHSGGTLIQTQRVSLRSRAALHIRCLHLLEASVVRAGGQAEAGPKLAGEAGQCSRRGCGHALAGQAATPPPEHLASIMRDTDGIMRAPLALEETAHLGMFCVSACGRVVVSAVSCALIVCKQLSCNVYYYVVRK